MARRAGRGSHRPRRPGSRPSPRGGRRGRVPSAGRPTRWPRPAEERVRLHLAWTRVQTRPVPSSRAGRRVRSLRLMARGAAAEPGGRGASAAIRFRASVWGPRFRPGRPERAVCPAHWLLLPTATVTLPVRTTAPLRVRGPRGSPQSSEVLFETSEVTRPIVLNVRAWCPRSGWPCALTHPGGL